MSLTEDIIKNLPKNDKQNLILSDRMGFDVWGISNIGRDKKDVYCLTQYPTEILTEEIEIFFDEILDTKRDYGNLYLEREGNVVAKISGIKSYRVTQEK